MIWDITTFSDTCTTQTSSWHWTFSRTEEGYTRRNQVIDRRASRIEPAAACEDEIRIVSYFRFLHAKMFSCVLGRSSPFTEVHCKPSQGAQKPWSSAQTCVGSIENAADVGVDCRFIVASVTGIKELTEMIAQQICQNHGNFITTNITAR
jgi:hypothetical protein